MGAISLVKVTSLEASAASVLPLSLSVCATLNLRSTHGLDECVVSRLGGLLQPGAFEDSMAILQGLAISA
jgi:hypothetical protein